ncbi:MAG: diguanylate cyclase [Chloroflexi bacterium]|nr:diguanylate cyclase [Chloroflexota bacterium]
MDARLSICWSYLYLGEFSIAFDHALLALKLARELGCKEREAHAQDALGSVYSKSAEYQNAIESHHEALRIVHDINDITFEAMVLNNMACSLLDMGNLPEALSASLKSIELTQHLGLYEEELIFYTTVADILIKMQEFERAKYYLEEALEKTSGAEFKKTHAYILVSMAGLKLAQKDFQAAEPYLLQALANAKKNDYKNDQMICYQLLGDVYENINLPDKALENFKRYLVLKEATLGADTARKIAMLKATHQLELSKREAEIFRSQNVELQHEIEERKRTESLLANLAIRDPLTNLFNKRQFSLLAAKEFERTIHHGYHLSVLFLDIDHFKQVNDLHGHLIGDKVLSSIAAIIQSTSRDTDIVGRFGGEEFAIILPEAPGWRAFQVGERLRKAAEESTFGVTSVPLAITVSIGIAQLPKTTAQEPAITLEELLNQADQALYTAKRSGRNQTCLYQEK